MAAVERVFAVQKEADGCMLEFMSVVDKDPVAATAAAQKCAIAYKNAFRQMMDDHGNRLYPPGFVVQLSDAFTKNATLCSTIDDDAVRMFAQLARTSAGEAKLRRLSDLSSALCRELAKIRNVICYSGTVPEIAEKRRLLSMWLEYACLLWESANESGAVFLCKRVMEETLRHGYAQTTMHGNPLPIPSNNG